MAAPKQSKRLIVFNRIYIKVIDIKRFHDAIFFYIVRLWYLYCIYHSKFCVTAFVYCFVCVGKLLSFHYLLLVVIDKKISLVLLYLFCRCPQIGKILIIYYLSLMIRHFDFHESENRFVVMIMIFQFQVARSLDLNRQYFRERNKINDLKMKKSSFIMHFNRYSF